MALSAPDASPATPWEAMAAPRGHLRLSWVGAWFRMVAWTLAAVGLAVWLWVPGIRVWATDPVGTWTALELEQVTDVLDRESRRDTASPANSRIKARSGELRRIDDLRARWRRLRLPLERLLMVMAAWGAGGLLALLLVEPGGQAAARVARMGGLLGVLWLVLQAGWDAGGAWWPILWVLPATWAVERAMLRLLLLNRCPWPFPAHAPPVDAWRPPHPEASGPTAAAPQSGEPSSAPLPARGTGESLRSHAARLRELARQRQAWPENRVAPPLGRRWREACASGTPIVRVDLAREALLVRPAWLGLMAHDDFDAVRQALLEEGPEGRARVGRPLWRKSFLGRLHPSV
ncbi:MAG: hypothetical protein FJY99_07535 [Candidatus Sericytochromatia bacterium]|nr:hypothetical protein [Candidatus Tanganyikabacteria bacterium]